MKFKNNQYNLKYNAYQLINGSETFIRLEYSDTDLKSFKIETLILKR
jgi:hypothetical protein